MTAHHFYDQKMAIGLTWLAPVLWSSSGRERRKKRELSALKMEVIGYSEMETPAGYQLGATGDKEDLGLISGAARLAQVQRSAVLIEQLEADLFWLCTIEDGAVFPAGDLVGSKDLITERLKEIRSDIAGKGIHLYDKSGAFDIEGSLDLNFEELVKDSSLSTDISCRPFQRRKINKPVLGVAVAAVVVCSAFGSWQFIERNYSVDKQRLARQQAERQIFEQEKIELKQSLRQHAPALLAKFADAVYDRPLRAGGWRTYSYEWQDGVVSVTWHREHGNTENIATHLGKGQFEFSEDAKVLTEKFPFAATSRSPEENLEERLSTQTNRMQLLDKLAKLPGHWSLKPAETLGNQYEITRSTLSGGSNQLNELISAAFDLNDLPLHINRVKVTLASSFNWELEGDYFAYSE